MAKDKKIAPSCFRTLEPGESRELIMRHGSHKDNILTDEAIRQAMATGAALAASGVKIDNCVSSPSPRAIRTCLAAQEGYKKMMYIKTEPALSDLAYYHADKAADLKAHMESLGRKWCDPDMAKTIFDDSDVYFPVGMSLALDAKRGFAQNALLGKTTFITTHGVGRIEPGIILLRGERIHIPERLVETGQIIELILDASSNIVEKNWLETIVPAQ